MHNNDNKIILRNETITVIKVMMMLFVVLCHSCSLYTGSGWGGYNSISKSVFWGNVSKILGVIHTQMFTFASGYFFYYVRYIKGKYRDRKNDFIRRCKRLLFPYIFASVFWVIPVHCIIYGRNVIDILRRFVFAESPAQLWFLVMLLGEYIVFYYLSDFLLKYNVIIVSLGLIILGYASIVMSRFIPLGYFQISNIIQYSIYYYLGLYYCSKSVRKFSLYGGCLASILFVLLSFVYIRVSLLTVFGGLLLKPFISILGIYACLAIVSNINTNRIIDCWFIKILARYSMGIYLIHQQVIYFTMRIFDKLLLLPIAIVILNFCISIFISMMLCLLADRNRFTKQLLGI